MHRQYKTQNLKPTKEQAMPEIYIYAVEGRTMDQKRSLVKDVTDAVVRHFQVTPGDVMVQIMETPKTSKAKGGILFSDRPGEQTDPMGTHKGGA
jgi:4-oxalocrotonate tautomerase